MLALDCNAQYSYSRGPFEYKISAPRNYWADYSKAKAAGKNLTGFLRGEDAFGLVFADFKCMQSYTSRDFSSGEILHDTSFSLDLKPKTAFGVTGSTSIPICDFGDNAALLFSYGATFNYIKVETDSLHLGNNYHIYAMRTVQAGLPLTIDYKTGGEAMLDKTRRSTVGFGVGCIPTMSSTLINAMDATTSFNVNPYAKAEFGVFWKICMKLRFSCQLGKYNLMELDNYGSSHYATNRISLKSGPIYTLSLVLMPLSFEWNEGSWY